jgi:hypothetical protein
MTEAYGRVGLLLIDDRTKLRLHWLRVNQPPNG